MNIRRHFTRTAATVSMATIAGFLAPLGAGAATAPGSCDFGHVAVIGFVCTDSDDLRNRVGPAHTDNGVLDDALDVDWYEQIGGTTRHVRVRGELFLDAGAVGKATIRVRCLRADGSVFDTKTAEIVSNSSFHTGIGKSANLECTSSALHKVDVRITYQDFGGSRSNTESARFHGN